MSGLYINSTPINSIFNLLGEKENNMSFSFAWALTRCPHFLKRFVEQLLSIRIDPEKVNINIQHHEKNKGITDIEIEVPNELFIIIEAKKGPILPTFNQLKKYATRKSINRSKARHKRIIALTDCSSEYANSHGIKSKINGIKIDHIPWKDVFTLAKQAKRYSDHAGKRLLDELLIYLKGVIEMQDVDTNWVYVVSLGMERPRNWKISFVDIVEKKRLYFHRVGRNGWPKDPVTYIAFRYHGRLQSIHHIEGYDIVRNMHSKIPEIPKGEWEADFFLYKLGKPFVPQKTVKVGRIFRNGRVWCMLDTLFTSKTISQARDISKKRMSIVSSNS